MEINTIKQQLLITNEKDKKNWIKVYEDIRPLLIGTLNKIYTTYLKEDRLNKFFLIHNLIYFLSFYKDDEVLEILNRFHLSTFTPKVFIDYNSLLESIPKHNAESTLHYNLSMIISAYNSYSKFIVKQAICNDLDIDYIKIAEKMNRQYKAGNSPKPLVDQVAFLKETKKLLKEHNIHFRFKEQTPFTSASHEFKYPHKGIFRNLYDILLDLNNQLIPNFNQADLKVEFYDLLSLILRDKSILNINSESELLYGEPGNTRFKKKTIEYLFLR